MSGLFVTATYLFGFLKIAPYSSNHLETLQGLSLTAQSITLLCDALAPPPQPLLNSSDQASAESWRALLRCRASDCVRCDVGWAVACGAQVRPLRLCLNLACRSRRDAVHALDCVRRVGGPA
eukprot:652316-Rhodomonas_salina.2